MPSQLSDLAPLVLEHVASCSEVQAMSAIRQTVVDFYKRAKLYWVELTPISIVAAQRDYALANPTGYQILHIRSGTIDDTPIITTSEEQLDLSWTELQRGFSWRYYHNAQEGPAAVEDWRLAESDVPGLVYQLTPNVASLVGLPTTAIADGLKLKVVCFPELTVTEIDTWIYNTEYETLRNGAVARLKGMKDKPFSDPRGLSMFANAYEGGVLTAESRGLRGYKRNDQQQRRTQVHR